MLIGGCMLSAIYFKHYTRISSYLGLVNDVASMSVAYNSSFAPLPLFYCHERQQYKQQQETPAGGYGDNDYGGSDSCDARASSRCYSTTRRNNGEVVAELEDYTAFNKWFTHGATKNQQRGQVDANDIYDENYDHALWICRKQQEPQSSSRNSCDDDDNCTQQRDGEDVITTKRMTTKSILKHRNRKCFPVLPTNRSVKQRLLDSCLEYDTNRYIVNIVQTWLFPFKQWLSGHHNSDSGFNSSDRYNTAAAFFPTCRVRVSSIVFSSHALAVNGLHTSIEYVDVASYLNGSTNNHAARVESILSFRRKLVRLLIFSATEFDDTTSELRFHRRLTNHSSCILSPTASQQYINGSQTNAPTEPQQQQQAKDAGGGAMCVVWESVSSDKFYVFITRHEATRYVFVLNAQRSIYMACDDSFYRNWTDNRLIFELLLRNSECQLYDNCHSYLLKVQYLLSQ